VHQREDSKTVGELRHGGTPSNDGTQSHQQPSSRKEENVSVGSNFVRRPPHDSFMADVNAHEAHVRGRKGRTP
jgi:hypothetical protein